MGTSSNMAGAIFRSNFIRILHLPNRRIIIGCAVRVAVGLVVGGALGYGG